MPSSKYPETQYEWFKPRIEHACQKMQASLNTIVEQEQWDEELLFLGGIADLLNAAQAGEKIQKGLQRHGEDELKEIQKSFSNITTSAQTKDDLLVFDRGDIHVAKACAQRLHRHRKDKSIDANQIASEAIPDLASDHFDEIRGILEQCQNVADSSEEALRELMVMAECYFDCIVDWGAAPSWLIERVQSKLMTIAEQKGFEVDDEMREIFLEEAAELQEAIQEALEQEGSAESVASIKRDLHTLKGGARMVGYSQIGDYVHELEQLYEIFEKEKSYLTADNLRKVKGAHDVLDGLVRAVEQGILSHDLSQEIKGLKNIKLEDEGTNDSPEVIEPSPKKEASEAIDQELVDIYKEESEELQEMLEQSLEALSRDLNNLEPVQAIKRDLHTLKGGARMIGQSALGDQVHDLEQSYERIEKTQQSITEEQLKVLKEQHDQIKTALALIGQSTEPSLPESADPQPSMEEEKAIWRSKQSIKVPIESLMSFNQLISVATVARTQVESDVQEIERSLSSLSSDLLKVRNLQESIKSDLMNQGLMSHDLRELMRDIGTLLSKMVRNNEHTRDTLHSAESLLFDARHAVAELQRGLTNVQLVPIASVVPRLEKIVDQLCRELHKKINFVHTDTDGLIDRQTLERLIPPFEHMLRNAIDHGVDTPENRLKMGKQETGTIALSVRRAGTNTLISFKDDGRGINVENVRKKAIAKKMLDPKAKISDQEALRFILQPGFSTSDSVTQVSGRGVGMDVVNSDVEKLGGTLLISTEKGLGTTFTIVLPFTQGLSEVLLFSLANHWYSIQTNNIQGIVRIPYEEALAYLEADEDFEYKGQEYAFRYLGTLLHKDQKPQEHYAGRVMPVILLQIADSFLALLVDHVMGARKVVTKSTGPHLKHVKEFSGACVLPNGRVVLILDAVVLENIVLHDRQQGNVALHAARNRIMVVDDSVTVRKMTKKLLDKHNYGVQLAKDGMEAMEMMQQAVPSLVLLDVDMPRMNGYEVASAMKIDPKLSSVPVIMISSRNSDSHRDQAKSLGVDKVLTKPYQEQVLIGMIQTLLGE